MQAPMKSRDLAEAKQKRRAETAAHTVGLVSPEGNVTAHVCSPPGEGEDDGIRTGDTPVRWANGEPAVWKPYREKGYRMLKEVCESDGCPEKYDEWKAVIAAQLTRPGIPIRGNVEDLYPPTVLELRGSRNAGGTGDGMAFVIGEGIKRDPKLAAEKVLGQLLSAGLPAPTDEQLLEAEAKAAKAERKRVEKVTKEADAAEIEAKGSRVQP